MIKELSVHGCSTKNNKLGDGILSNFNDCRRLSWAAKREKDLTFHADRKWASLIKRKDSSSKLII